MIVFTTSTQDLINIHECSIWVNVLGYIPSQLPRRPCAFITCVTVFHTPSFRLHGSLMHLSSRGCFVSAAWLPHPQRQHGVVLRARGGPRWSHSAELHSHRLSSFLTHTDRALWSHEQRRGPGDRTNKSDLIPARRVQARLRTPPSPTMSWDSRGPVCNFCACPRMDLHIPYREPDTWKKLLTRGWQNVFFCPAEWDSACSYSNEKLNKNKSICFRWNCGTLRGPLSTSFTAKSSSVVLISRVQDEQIGQSESERKDSKNRTWHLCHLSHRFWRGDVCGGEGVEMCQHWLEPHVVFNVWDHC